MTAAETTLDEPGPAECWCCGTRAETDQLVPPREPSRGRVCTRCAHSLSKWAWELEDRSRTGPAARTRSMLRLARKGVVARGWQHSRLIGRSLRALGKHLP